ncbi:transcriptional regulator [Candidatus Saccharibacteria bacterium]|nr:transcriptional regulator [Candidatus Saccharibacteria bacterium]MBQ6149881.1 transcriptional regulator [Candidatus Saccharibacteria bacterium]
MSKESNTPVEKLFGSKTRAKLLQLFFTSPTKSFYIREMTRVIDEQINSVRRELSNLESIGIIKNESFDNKVYYSANSKHPFYRPMIDIFSKKIDTTRDHDVKESTWSEYCRPVQKYLAGLVVTNRLPGQDGLDLLIIGNDRTKKLTRWAEVIEKKQGKTINYAIMTPEDFTYRKSVKDRFIEDVLEMEIIEIIDPEGLINGKEK